MARDPQFRRPSTWISALALACAGAHLAYALWIKTSFAHLGSPLGRGAVDIVANAALATGLVASVMGARAGSRSSRCRALLAGLLLLPFALDPLLAGLLGASLSVADRQLAFQAAVLTASAALLGFGLRGGAGAERRSPSPILPAAGTARPASLARKLGVLLISMALALILGEWALRQTAPVALIRPRLLLPSGQEIPIAEITTLRHWGAKGTDVGQGSGLRPRLYLRGWYDRASGGDFDAEGCVDYVLNGFGLRDDDFPLSKPAGEYRVVAIGDSFTFGIGVQFPHNWTEVLEDLLARRRGGDVQVVNAGFASGHDPIMYAPWIEQVGLDLEPDVVVVALCLNDLDSRVRLYAYHEFLPVEPFGVHSELLARGQRAWRQLIQPPLVGRNYARFVPEGHERWLACQRALVSTRDLLAERGVRFVLAIMPMMSGLAPTYAYQELNDRVAAFCAASGIECVDLVPQVLGRDERELWVHPTDQHPNALGHRLIAEGIFAQLAEG